MSEQDLLKHLRMRPYSNPSFWMLEAADEIERLRREHEQTQAERSREFESRIGNDPRKRIQQLQAEIEWLKSDRDYWWRVADERLRRLDDLSGDLSALSAGIEQLRAYTDACNTLLAERVEIECLRGLAIRAWHSFRSGLSATGGCRDGLTDGDILELVRLSNIESAKLRGHDSVTATIAENEREDEPIE